ncbi:MAG: hypothetical protein QRY74_00385 [Chlamydia sp.]
MGSNMELLNSAYIKDQPIDKNAGRYLKNRIISRGRSKSTLSLSSLIQQMNPKSTLIKKREIDSLSDVEKELETSLLFRQKYIKICNNLLDVFCAYIKEIPEGDEKSILSGMFRESPSIKQLDENFLSFVRSAGTINKLSFEYHYSDAIMLASLLKRACHYLPKSETMNDTELKRKISENIKEFQNRVNSLKDSPDLYIQDQTLIKMMPFITSLVGIQTE